MVVELEITKDLLKVLPLINIQHFEKEYKRVDVDSNGKEFTELATQQVLQIDTRNLLVGNDPIEDIAFALGIAPQSEADSDGVRSYGQDIYDKFESMYNYIKDNLYYIESLIHQKCCEGIKEGIYQALDNELIWEYVKDPQIVG